MLCSLGCLNQSFCRCPTTRGMRMSMRAKSTSLSWCQPSCASSTCLDSATSVCRTFIALLSALDMFSISSAVYFLSARLSVFAIRSAVYFLSARLSTCFRGILHLFRIGFPVFLAAFVYRLYSA
ncbi:hypothetical protein F4604DRAFT_1803998 [Suillus subluteus]|nr:hypothetical protein F4604DRAFT_1803998 [Suillus subluteus]